MRCRHQRAWPLRTELLEKLSCLRKGSERYEGEGERSMQISITCACSSKEKNGTEEYSLSPASHMASSYHHSPS